MARELGPQGIYVAHIVVDGAVDSQFIRENLPDADERPGTGRAADPGRGCRELCLAATTASFNLDA